MFSINKMFMCKYFRKKHLIFTRKIREVSPFCVFTLFSTFIGQNLIFILESK